MYIFCSIHLIIMIGVIVFVEIHGYPTEKEMLRKPYENPDLIEGDMLFHPSPESMSRGVAQRGNGVAWTNGIVPYEFQSEYTSEQQAFIVAAMRKLEHLVAINNVVCIQFRPKRSTDRYYIYIAKTSGCSSYVGQSIHGMSLHTVSLEYPGCFFDGIVMHELLHTLGFYHEQSRPDRDNYVRVLYENIPIDNQHNFEKYDDTFVDTLNTSYDYSSIMHYRKDAFSSNGLPTIEPLQSNVTIGQRANLSSIDIHEVRFLYNCSAVGVTLPEIHTTTTPNLYPVNTTISSAWTSNSQKFIRLNGSTSYNYYEAYRVTVPINGSYIFTSESMIDTYGYLYLDSFLPNFITHNLIASDDDSGDNSEFQFTIYLHSNVTYILVATTYNEHTTGEFSVIISGLTKVNIAPIDNTTVTLMTNVTPPRFTTTTTPNSVESYYHSALTVNSLVYNREDTVRTYYYEAIQINVPISGTYNFNSVSNIDTYGYLYRSYFDPKNTVANLLTNDDDSGGDSQFLISYTLYPFINYILITTTFNSSTKGAFSIRGTGPAAVIFRRINTIGITSTTSRPLSTTTSASNQLNTIMIYFIGQWLTLYLIQYVIIVV
ncbi:hypothetical protein I4U23_023303 [Adineta vaga]|nr:hypothetical protein I4U23_023303 [Adineta vaga]